MVMPKSELAGRYVLEDRVASGGMAEVWRAHDDILARTVAVKMLHEHLELDPAFVERFRSEALAAARLSHPNIVAIYDSGQHENDGGPRDYIVMEHCTGSLRHHLNERQPLDVDEVVSIGVTLCDALAHAHEVGIVHSDLKPDNVFLADDGTLKISDFGIARAALERSPDIATTATILGSVRYLAPEQLQGSSGDTRSDVYSLGAVLYELLTGRPPLEEEAALAVVEGEWEPPLAPRNLRAGVPRGTDAAVMRALERDPARRWQSASEFGRALQGSAPSGATRAIPRVSSVEPEERDRSSESRWLIGVVVAIALVVIAALTIPALLEDDAEGPAGSTQEDGTRASGVKIQSVRDFDPFGDGTEHATKAELARDGDPTTAWHTEDYNTSLADQKPGVGLVFDLGETRSVDMVVVTGSDGAGVDVRAADEEPVDVDTVPPVIASEELEAETEFDASGAEARYWVIWITDLPGVTGSAEIFEVEFIGS